MVQKNGQKNLSKVVQQSMFYPVRLQLLWFNFFILVSMPYYMLPKSFPYVLSLSVRQDGYKLVLGIYLFLIQCIPIFYSVNFIFKTVHKPVKPLE